MSTYTINLADKTKFVQGVDDIKQSWALILMTIPGTVPLFPTLGSNLFQYLDQPINKAFSGMANTIIKDLEYWEKRATISKVTRTLDGSTIKLMIQGINKATKAEIIQDIVVNEVNGGIGYMIIGSTFILM